MVPQSEDRFLHERELCTRGIRRIAGVDEAGRGPLAGPVVAAAVILPEAWIRGDMPDRLWDLNDSKQVAPARREALFEALIGNGAVEYGIALVESGVIDAINILQATHRAMNEALRKLHPAADHALVDGRRVPNLSVCQTPLVKGDRRSYTIAAASILAKVTRDRWMKGADLQWPGYGFAVHKGYPTPQHLEALSRLGPCPIHRRTFAPLRTPDPELFPA